MKRIIAVLLALVMLLALAGCGAKEPEILGTYETKYDITDLVVESFDAGTGVGEELSLRDYIQGEMSLVMISQFNEDGTYSQYVKEESMEQILANMKTAAVPFFEDFSVKIFIETFGVSTREEVEELIGMSIEEAYIESFGIDIQGTVDQLFEEISMEDMLEGTDSEGHYKAEGGKLYLSDSLDTQYDETMYETYTIAGDTVTITDGVNVEENLLITYPFTLVKVS